MSEPPLVPAAVPSSETALEEALKTTLRLQAYPPALSAALRDAVFGGGARLRPQLCLAVHAACGTAGAPAAMAAATAIELLHCASLVHDDLPCFDDATMRRQRPALHRAHGERLAVLGGDGLIVAAFAALQRCASLPPAIFGWVARAGAALVTGQGWESEVAIDLEAYHAAKSGALFAAAAACGALAGGQNERPWASMGQALGQAYQLADDLGDEAEDGQSGAQPNWAQRQGRAAASKRLQQQLLDARTQAAELSAAVCGGTGSDGGAALQLWLAGLQRRLVAQRR